MTEFDKKLNNKLHEWKAHTRLSFKDIAELTDIKPHTLYGFTSEVRALNSEDTYKLMNYLNLTVELKEKQ